MAQSEAEIFPRKDEDSMETWARKRKSYIWRHGVFGNGGFLFIWLTFFDWYKKGYIRLPPLRVIFPGMLITLAICLVTGYWIGASSSKRHV